MGIAIDRHSPSLASLIAVGFGFVAPGLMSLPFGWTSGAGADAASRAILDERGRERALLTADGDGPGIVCTLLARFTVGLRSLDPGRPPGTSVSACVLDAGAVALAWDRFDVSDALSLDVALRKVTAWLDAAVPRRDDPTLHWGGPPLPRDGAGSTRPALPSPHGVLTIAADVRPSRDALEALGFAFEAMPDPDVLLCALPTGWGAGGAPGRIHDRHGRPRAMAVPNRVDGPPTISLLPRYSVGTVLPGTAAGQAIGLGPGRVRVAILDAGRPVVTSPEFGFADRGRTERETRRLTRFLARRCESHDDPTAHWGR